MIPWTGWTLWWLEHLENEMKLVCVCTQGQFGCGCVLFNSVDDQTASLQTTTLCDSHTAMPCSWTALTVSLHSLVLDVFVLLQWRSVCVQHYALCVFVYVACTVFIVDLEYTSSVLYWNLLQVTNTECSIIWFDCVYPFSAYSSAVNWGAERSWCRYFWSNYNRIVMLMRDLYSC